MYNNLHVTFGTQGRITYTVWILNHELQKVSPHSFSFRCSHANIGHDDTFKVFSISLNASVFRSTLNCEYILIVDKFEKI